METPYFSIIIPVYNAEKYIKRCLDSVKAQKNTEILVVDDGSSDDSLQIIQTCAKECPMIHVIHQENRGVASARNHGMFQARGKYVLFVDADDKLHEDALHEIYDKIHECEPDIIAFNYILTGKTGEKEIKNIADTCCVQLNHSDVQWENFGLQYVWNKVWKREFLIENKILFPEKLSLGEDTCFVNKAILHANAILYISKALYDYSEPDGKSLSSKYIEDMGAIVDMLYRQHQEILKQYPDFSKLILESKFYETLCVHDIYNMYHEDSTMNRMERISKLKNYFFSPIYSSVSTATANNIGKKYLIYCYKKKKLYLMDFGLETLRMVKRIRRRLE